jgi:hypothetical protein
MRLAVVVVYFTNHQDEKVTLFHQHQVGNLIGLEINNE